MFPALKDLMKVLSVVSDYLAVSWRKAVTSGVSRTNE